MRKFAFLLFTLFLFYGAAMFRYLPLCILAAMQLFLLFLMACQAHFCRRRLTVSFSRETEEAFRKETGSFRVTVENRSRIPVRFQLRMRAGDQKGQRFYGLAEPGESQVSFVFKPLHCGFAKLQIRKLYLYPAVPVWPVKKKTAAAMRTVVFPGEKSLKILLGDPSSGQRQEETEAFLSRRGTNLEEVRQIREYRDGDPLRHIHWKLSARADQLLLKEYEDRPEPFRKVLLDLSGLGEGPGEERDRYFETLSALLLGLLACGLRLRVCWTDGEDRRRQAEVTERDHRKELFWRLYRDLLEGCPRNAAEPEEDFFLGKDMSLYFNGRLVFLFSREDWEQELETGVFFIS